MSFYFLSTSATNSVRFSFALFQCQRYIFTLLCEDNTDRAFLLWSLKQIFCSSLTGLASVLNFKGTTARSTEILYRGKKSISSSPDFLFSHVPTSRNSIQYISKFTAKLIDACQFSANGISLRLGEVEMKILQSLPDFKPWRSRYESVNYRISNYWFTSSERAHRDSQDS